MAHTSTSGRSCLGTDARKSCARASNEGKAALFFVSCLSTVMSVTRADFGSYRGYVERERVTKEIRLRIMRALVPPMSVTRMLCGFPVDSISSVKFVDMIPAGSEST